MNILLASAAFAVPAAEAMAQAAPAPKTPAPAAKPAARPGAAGTVGEIVITGQTTGYRSSIDRKSYSVVDDLAATTGSIGDALRSVPSVEVDVSGNLSLRGDPNVTILIDGKPSGMFRGDGRADALQQLPAEDIERVEVVTNPSAAFRPDGTGGVINLITKQSRKPGKSGSVRANAGTGGRYNGGFTASYNSRTLTVTGDAAVRHDDIEFTSTDDRSRLDPVSGAFLDSGQVTTSRTRNDIRYVRGSVDYDLNARDRLSGEVRYNKGDQSTRSTQDYDGLNAAGLPLQSYVRAGTVKGNRSNLELSGDWRRKFGDDHQLTAHLSHEHNENQSRRRYTTDTALPASGQLFEDINSATLSKETDFKLEYSRPLPDDVKLKLGYEIDAEDNDYDNRGSRGPTQAGLAVDPTLTNRFLYQQTVHSLYGTYERPFGDFTVLGGVRLVQVLSDLNQVTSNIKAGNDYLRAYPSLHLSYRLSDEQSVSASYSHRVSRPNPQDLNPYRIYQDPFNYRAGNPNLKPADTDSFELGYQVRKGGTYYLATAYYRRNTNGFTDVVRDLGGGVLLSTRENLGESRSGGLELVANGRLNSKLTYNINGNLYWNEIDAASLGFAGTRSTYAMGGRANFNYQLTSKDFVQVNGFMMGKRLTPQGYRKGAGVLNLGYRHKYSDSLTFVVTANDVLKTFKDRLVVETPTLNQTVRNKNNGRAVFIGFTKTFGGNANRRPQAGGDFEDLGGGGDPGAGGGPP